ncbi:MAG: mercuric reductase [Desulfobacteraceae bacterium]|nr:MAG: mercuric reductase [Desulfobacteraceae bacterium]
MNHYDFDIGIIGGGAAGLTVASGSAQLGAKTFLVEKEGVLGGDCLHFGCVPSKTLIRTARLYHAMKKAKAFGLPQPDVPPVDFLDVRERIRSVIGTIQQHDSVERFCSLGVRVEFGSPAFRDEHSVVLDGKTHTAGKWVISTGSSPSIPKVKGLDSTPFLTNREIFALKRLPGSMVILGGGPIGVEMAQAFCRLGTRVTLIQRSGQILPKEDRDMAEDLMAILVSEGVAIHLNTSVLSVKNLGSEREIHLKSREGSSFSLRAEEILVATGRTANTAGLSLENAGVEHDLKGVHVDHRLRTSQNHIFAAGDVTGKYQFTHAAGYEGGVVVSNAVFRLPRRSDYTFLPWCTYTDPELASIGMNEKSANAAGVDFTVWTSAFRDNDRSLAEGGVEGRIKMILGKNEKPIGVQILGSSAGELIGEWVAVLNGKVSLTKIATAVHPYPTLGEINKKVAGDYLAPKIFSDRVRKGLKFFFNLKGRACG